MKKFIWAIVLVFVSLWVMDFIMHGVILAKSYEQTASLWRPLPEMKTTLIYIMNIVTSIIFVWIYSLLNKKGVSAGLKYGLLYGIAAGFGMGFGSYATTPVTLYIATVWFLGTIVQMTLAGLMVGIVIRA